MGNKATSSVIYLPGNLEKIALNCVPENVITFFEGKSRLFISPEEYKKGSFENFFVFDYLNGDGVYVAKQIKTYSTNGNTEELIYLFEFNSLKEKTGHGEIRFNISDSSGYFKDKPFVGFSNTEKLFRKRGLGKRRLVLMNFLSKYFWDLKLNSDTIINRDAEKLWKDLVKENRALRYFEGKNARYRFL